ncbi:Glycoside hydrolase, 38 vacuolar alpha mannosidase [Massospora cicadina]|nr:Glycoside hydrolase, 38 vacuolar alpha mannosidase [Massospora cicadina]
MLSNSTPAGGAEEIGSLQKHRGITLSRLDLFLAEGDQFSDVNLTPHYFLKRKAGEEAVQLTHYAVPDLKRIPFKEAIAHKFAPTKVGEVFGPSWSTHWFQVRVTIPKGWVGHEVQFRWNSNSEVLVWSMDGEPIQGLVGEGGGNQRLEYTLTKESRGGEEFNFYLEMACNGLFGNGAYLIGPPENRTYPILLAELAVPNALALKLRHDFGIIRDLAKKLPETSSRGARALRVANKVMNLFRRDGDPEALKRCLEVTGKFLRVKGAAERHTLVAVGHCHIDTAWLWPYGETRRKTARSWATQLQLMETYPDFKFVCSQAQQYEWLEADYPGLFARIKAKAGQFLPIGGTWVEMDCNVPSGEALCRQFLLGQRYFQEHFGRRCRVFWLPDTFGYSAQLPQIIQLSAMAYFFTQKLSWNNINKFPHTTFHWVGLDGTRVLAHMAPGETYNAQGVVEDILFSEANNKDKGVVNGGLYLFGNGDGGGGPLPAMIERINRMRDVEGLPKVQYGSAEAFYDEVAASEEVNELPEWHGELYLELHRGTYTSHASIKKYNRYTELLLRDLEVMATLAKVLRGAAYPSEAITHLWKLVCLNQFHDVLPGSAIGLVYDDALDLYREVVSKADAMLDKAYAQLVPGEGGSEGYIFFNGLAWNRTEVITVPKSDCLPSSQVSKDGRVGYVVAREETCPSTAVSSVEHDANNGKFILSNPYLRVVVNAMGQIISLIDRRVGRELVAAGERINQFVMHEDIPLYWDAWDVEVYHLEKYQLCNGKVSVQDTGPMVSSLVCEYELSPTSKLRQLIRLTAVSEVVEFENEVDWDENRRFLKVQFPVAIHSDFATYETQFGAIRRPTHYNTSWDLAKFEVCSHKFADLSEAGYGFAVLNDSKYGFATCGNHMRLSLIRAPKSPDDRADIGTHRFRYGVYPHPGSFQDSEVVRRAHEFNSPMRHRLAPPPDAIPHHLAHPDPILGWGGLASVVLDTLKVSEDDPSALILRLYESVGARGCGHLTLRLPVAKAFYSNVMEDEVSPLAAHAESFRLNFLPFQIVTLKLILHQDP